MSAKSDIGWLKGGSTWNFLVGCTKVSPGCRNCWAERMAVTRLRNHPNESIRCKYSRVTDRCGWTGDLVSDNAAIGAPTRWKKPRLVFPVSMGDLWHDMVDDWLIDQAVGVALGTAHTFLFLTKRSERMAEYFTTDRATQWATAGCLHFKDAELAFETIRGAAKAMANIWLGVTVEDNAHVSRIEDLIKISSVPVRWVSCEPLLEELDLSETGKPDWIIAGCNRLPGNRTNATSLAPYRALRNYCIDNHIPYFLKQMPNNGKVGKEPELDGRQWLQFPKLNN